jgi:hypothetical protein
MSRCFRGEQITLHIRFRGGADKTVTLPNPLRAWESWMTDAEVLGRIDQLLDTKTFAEIASILNQSGVRSGKGQRFTARYIARIQKHYALRSRFDRLRVLGLLTLDEMSQTLSVNPKTVRTWAAHGLLTAHAYTDKPECLYEPPGPDHPRKELRKKLSFRRPATTLIPECSKEVQYET